MRENAKAAPAQIEKESQNQAERKTDFGKISLNWSRRQPSPDIIQIAESLEEDLRSTAKEIKVVREEVAGLKRDRALLKATIARL